MKLEYLFVVYFSFFIFSALFESADAITDILIGSIFGYIFDEIFENYFGPASKLLFGGPTQLVSNALYGATPLLHPSIFGERFDQFFFTTAGWAIGFIANLITTTIQQTLSWSFEGSLLAIQGTLVFMDALVLKRELPSAEFLSSITKLIRKDSLGLTKEIKEGRSLNLLEGPNPAQDLLDNNPVLKKFSVLAEKDSDDCLKGLLCSINAAPDEALTAEERTFKSSFSNHTKAAKRLPTSLRPLTAAASFGNSFKSQKECQNHFPKCYSPFVFRTLFIYMQRWNAK